MRFVFVARFDVKLVKTGVIAIGRCEKSKNIHERKRSTRVSVHKFKAFKKNLSNLATLATRVVCKQAFNEFEPSAARRSRKQWRRTQSSSGVNNPVRFSEVVNFVNF